MILATVLLLTAQPADTTDLRELFRTAIVAAFDTLQHDSPRLAAARHVELNHQSFRRLTSDTSDWSSLASALGPRGTAGHSFDCDDGPRCPIISAVSVAQVGADFDVIMELDHSMMHEGKFYISIAQYRVHLVRKNGHMVVSAVRMMSIT